MVPSWTEIPFLTYILSPEVKAYSLSLSMIDYIEDTNETLISYDPKMFKANAENDLNKIISDIEKAMDVLNMEKN